MALYALAQALGGSGPSLAVHRHLDVDSVASALDLDPLAQVQVVGQLRDRRGQLLPACFSLRVEQGRRDDPALVFRMRYGGSPGCPRPNPRMRTRRLRPSSASSLLNVLSGVISTFISCRGPRWTRTRS